MFDGSSIAGWKSIESSDMKLMMDTESTYIDPFYAEKTMCVHCSVVEPDTGEAYERDPRSTAEKAEAYLISSGIGDTAFFGPEAEFFLFDDDEKDFLFEERRRLRPPPFCEKREKFFLQERIIRVVVGIQRRHDEIHHNV